MIQPALMAVKNRTKETQILTHDGASLEFAPGQIRLVSRDAGHHAVTRVHVKHREGKDGKPLQTLDGHKLFEEIPLAEALKHVKPDEHPSLAEAKKQEEEKAREREALKEDLKAEIREELKAEGWRPPKGDGK